MEIFKEVKIEKPKGIISVTVEGPTHGRRESKTTNAVTKALMEYLYTNEVVSSGPGVDSAADTLALGDGSTAFDYDSVGLGNSLLTVSSLSKEKNSIDIGGVTWVGVTYSKVLLPGEFVGTVAEIGLLDNQTLLAGKVLDQPIDVFADDQVSIKYTLAVNPNGYPKQLSSGTVTVDGSDYDFTITQSDLYIQYSTTAVKVATPHNGEYGEVFYINNSAIANDSNGESSIAYEYNESGRYAEWILDALVYASWSGTQIEDFDLYRYSAGANRSVLNLEFTPPIPRPASHKIILKFRFRYSW